MPNKKIYADDFSNAREMNENYPETFEWVEPPQRENMKRGDLIKVANGKERFWCSFRKNGIGNLIVAEVDNVLISTQGYNLGDWICFNRDNIYEYVPKNNIKNYFNDLINNLRKEKGDFNTNIVERMKEENGAWEKVMEDMIMVPESFGEEETDETNMFPHREVARAFVPNPNNYKYVEHIDGNTINNNATNLRWVEEGGDKELFDNGYKGN